MDDLLKKGKEAVSDNCLITGGHFRIFFEGNEFKANLNEGTIVSLKAALELISFTRKKGLSTYLGLLINDMGSECSEIGCDLKALNFSREEYELPGVYQDLFTEYDIKSDEIVIYWEKHIRNRTKKDFLKILKKGKPQITKDLKGYYLLTDISPLKIVLTRTQGKDKYGVPACPLIMGGLNYQQSKKYNCSVNYYYIANDNKDNIPNYFVIEKAKTVAEFLGSGMDVNNIYFDKYKI
ncbi:hypothetical protein ACFLQQ_00970 [Actinomycetota bacterium]